MYFRGKSVGLPAWNPKSSTPHQFPFLLFCFVFILKKCMHILPTCIFVYHVGVVSIEARKEYQKRTRVIDTCDGLNENGPCKFIYLNT